MPAMWIPRPVYEAIPYACLATGAAMFAAAFLVPGGPHGLLFGCGGIVATLGLLLWMRRRDYRTTQADYDPHALDD
jgi:hypothetical protein